MARVHGTDEARKLVSRMAEYREYIQDVAAGKPKDDMIERAIAALREAEQAVTELTDAVESI